MGPRKDELSLDRSKTITIAGKMEFSRALSYGTLLNKNMLLKAIFKKLQYFISFFSINKMFKSIEIYYLHFKKLCAI